MQSRRSPEEIIAEILAITPRMLELCMPENLKEEKGRFLSGEVRNPSFNYKRLAELDLDITEAEMLALLDEINSSQEIPFKQLPIYREYIQYELNRVKLLRGAQNYNAAMNDQERQTAAEMFMGANVEMYGAPSDFEGVLASVIRDIDAKEYDPEKSVARSELHNLLPSVDLRAESYAPKEETVQYFGEVAQFMFGSLLRHVDDKKDSYSSEEIVPLLREILAEEFGEAAEDWIVELDKTTAINVVALDKRIRVPVDGDPVKTSTLKALIGHELGVHLLRALMGADTDMPLLAYGFAGYYDAEEGEGVVVGQAISGKYQTAGITHYMIVGLMASGLDFRAVHEIMWRKELLLPDPKRHSDLEGEARVQECKDNAFKDIFRIARLTNGLPWHKDLSYYNGAVMIWQYIEQNIGDYEKLQQLFMGKTDPTNQNHERLAYEAASM